MKETERLLLAALRFAIRGEAEPWSETLEARTQYALMELAQSQALLPVLAQAVHDSPGIFSKEALSYLEKYARQLTIGQAARTAEFLQLYAALEENGLHPAVIKGLVCRDLYPHPEQRASTDEDFLLPEEERFRCKAALLADGLQLVKEDADEAAYRDDDRGLYLEVHLRPFPSDSSAYGDCNRFFPDALSRTEAIRAYGCEIRTLCPTDHLLFLLLHAYKHVLHGGVGLRQLCDICLFAERRGEAVDWPYIRRCCREQRIEQLAAAIFQIGERHLGIPAPEAFADVETDELPLLKDSLSGGMFGADDPDRLHSSTLTLEAVSASKKGKRPLGALHSLFLPAASLSGRYPYLKKRPWLLPAARERTCAR